MQVVEEDLESPNSGLSHFPSALVSRCRELSRLPRCCVIVKTEDCIDKEKCSKRGLIRETLFSNLSPQMMSQNTSSLPLNSLLLKSLIEVPPDREGGLSCAPSSTTGKDSNSHKTSRESLPPSPPPGVSPLHFGRFTISFNSKISYVWSRAGYDLHRVHGRNEGDEKKKKMDKDNSRCRVLRQHRGQFSSALIRCFYHVDKNWQRGVHD